jgi:hypothetical protein
MEDIRLDHEFAKCTEEWGWKYHHMGVPTKEKMPNEIYIPQFKLYVSGFKDTHRAKLSVGRSSGRNDRAQRSSD